METLICIAISATGGAIMTETGGINAEQLSFANAYAKQTFIKLLSEWEEIIGTEWEIQ